MPFIEKKYPVSSVRTLVGHSLGGLVVMNILLKHKELFENYIAIDPSMWWDNNKLLSESVSILGSQSFDNKKLFLAIANEQDKKMTSDQIRKDTSAKTFMIRPSFLLTDLIEKNKQNGLWFQWKFYRDDHHMTVNTPATFDALKTIFPSARGSSPQSVEHKWMKKIDPGRLAALIWIVESAPFFQSYSQQQLKNWNAFLYQLQMEIINFLRGTCMKQRLTGIVAWRQKRMLDKFWYERNKLSRWPWHSFHIYRNILF